MHVLIWYFIYNIWKKNICFQFLFFDKNKKEVLKSFFQKQGNWIVKDNYNLTFSNFNNIAKDFFLLKLHTYYY